MKFVVLASSKSFKKLESKSKTFVCPGKLLIDSNSCRVVGAIFNWKGLNVAIVIGASIQRSEIGFH